MKANDEQLAYSVSEAAKAISVGKSTIYRLINDGEIDARKIGTRTLITASSLRRFVGEAA